jgi:hypothetical protein
VGAVPRTPALAGVATFALALIVCQAPAGASLRQDFSLSGYVRETPIAWESSSLMGGPSDRSTQLTNLLHLRQNMRWYASRSITVGVELKERILAGDGAGALLEASDLLGGTSGYFDWERRFVNEDRAVVVGTVDRAWLIAYAGPVQVTAGRQRVAWGTNLVWNTIDIFNPASPLDFDNEEKPGTDAGRVQVYLGPSSKAEVAVAPARDHDRTVSAGQLVLNRWGYDWVVLGGRRGTETVAGWAWAGEIKGGGFRGEFLYERPREGPSVLRGSVDGDYAFRSTLYLHGAALYNSGGTTGSGGGLELLEAYARGWLSPGRLSLYAEAGRDVTPLVHADLATILNAFDGSWYLGPTVTWSAATDLDVAAMGFIFVGPAGTEFGDEGDIIMARVKYSY